MHVVLRAAAWLLLSLALSACERCGGDKRAAIATLSTLVGSGVSRDYAEQPRTWVAAELGAQLSLGDGARTDAKSTAELTFINGATLALKPSTTIRLLVDGAGNETGIDVQAGEAQLRSRDRGLTLRTHLGLAMIAPETELTLTRDGDTLGLKVALGTVSFREQDAGDVGLHAGDDVTVGIGMAVLGAAGDGTREGSPGEIVLDVQSGDARLIVPGEPGARALTGGKTVVPAGAELRLANGGEVLVTRGRQRLRLRGAGEFVLGVDGALAESRRGRASFEDIQDDVAVRVPGGVIIARVTPEGTRAELNVSPEQSHLAVASGRVSADVNGQNEELGAGTDRTWPSRALPGGQEPGPAYHNLATPAGESFVVHAPVAPVAVGFSFGKKCPGEGLVEQVGGRQAARGVGSANLAFGAGMRSYTLRCIGANGAPGRIVARGTVQVLVDPGTRKLPPRAPTSNVEADGRTYTIYYQNQLPEVQVRWPNAPSAPKYTLEVDEKSIELSEPAHLFRSGSLGDGSHKLAFQAGGRRSRTTTVEVRFDNVAPKASLSSPEDRGFAPGDLVTIEGVALPTWKVTLEGGTIAMQPGERFTGQVQTSKEQPDVAVRISHPRLGTHYYLRRASGSP